MQIYALADLTASPVQGKSWTLGNQTVGVVITNYSNIGFNLSSDTRANIGTLPPYNTITIPATPGEVVSFAPSTITTTALPMADMFVNLAESGTAVTPNLTALALAPGYVQNVTGTVEFAAGQQVAIQGTTEVSFAAGQTVNIGNTPSVAISSGTVTANISNAEIPANVVNANLNTNPGIKGETISFPISNLAAGATVYYQGPVLSTIALIDELWLFVSSAQQIASSYGDFFLVELYRSDIGYGIKNINQMGIIQANSIYEQTVKFSVLDFPGDSLRIGISNTSSSTIVSDTLTFYFYAKYASQTVTNPALNSLKQTSFSYSWSVDSTGVITGTLPNNLNVLAAGGDIYTVVVDLSGTGAYSVSNGGSTFASGGTSQVDVHNVYPFSSGVPNNGINITGGSGGPSTAATLSGYIIHS